MTLNPSTNSRLSPVELMFMRKIRFMFDKLLPKENIKTIKKKHIKSYIPENIFFKEYRNRKEIWKTSQPDQEKVLR